MGFERLRFNKLNVRFWFQRRCRAFRTQRGLRWYPGCLFGRIGPTLKQKQNNGHRNDGHKPLIVGGKPAHSAILSSDFRGQNKADFESKSVDAVSVGQWLLRTSCLL